MKLAFISALWKSGLHEIEATSFVHPGRVPQLADADALWPHLPANGIFSALVPNMRGLDRALTLGVNRIALFTGASDAFTQANIGMSVAESLVVFEEVAHRFKQENPSGYVRGYISTAFECPYSGRVAREKPLDVGRRLLALGVDEVAFADTIGTASVTEVRELVHLIKTDIGLERVAFHFHDTWGMGLANVATAYDLGVNRFDASAGGLGGCPYAQGAGGNVATEDLVYFFEREGVETGIDLNALARASLPILALLGREPWSRAQTAVLSKA
jgi:hydroxymethylglutaryl-CoA lyase